MTEEERKRRGLQLTDEYERYVQDVLSARAAGLDEPRPITRVDTESGPEYRTLQKYVDPRDEMIASSPALVRPAYGILDRMLRPGRAGMADRMNREYMEGLLQRDTDQRRALAERQLIEAQGQKMQSDAALAEVERKAAEGDQDAIDQLEKYSRAMYAGRRTESPDYASQLIGTFGGRAGGQASGDRPPMIPTPEGARMPMRRAEPANPYANLSAEDAMALYESRVAQIDTAAQQQIDSAPLSSVLTNVTGGPAETVRQAEALKALNLRQLIEYHPSVAPQL